MMKISKKTVLISIFTLLILILAIFFTIKYFKYREYVASSPYDVVLSDISSNSVIISWKTQKELPSYIKIGESEKLWGEENRDTFHRVALSGLKEHSKYYFVISDGEREWDSVLLENSKELEEYVVKEFTFSTKEITEDIYLPEVEEISGLPNELIYVVLESSTNEISDIKSVYANRFGGAVVDIKTFEVEGGDWELKDIKYFSNTDEKLSSLNRVFAAEINCNQNISNQSIDGLNREQFADLANRWVAGRGKNYAMECYNDVIYRAKKEGVDPAFALTIWLNESGASNYTHNASLIGLIEDFGIHGQASAPPQNFNAQISYFLKLTYNYSCPGLTSWEAWGNMYRWGSCNENDSVKRQIGIDYYKGIESVYGLVTNGRKLPSQVTGLPKSDDGGENPEEGGWGEVSGPLCCALKISNQEKFQGDFENNAEGKTCSDIWKAGRSVYGGTLEYAVQIKDRVESACEVQYDGVCCQLQNDIKWYPKQSCSNAIPNITTSSACADLAKDAACFLRDAKYQWLPKSIGSDFINGITSQSQCEARNKISTYSLEFKKGINFVGLDFSPAYQTGALLASKLFESSSNIELVGNFKGYEWKDLLKKSETLPFAGKDFYLEQGRGYLVIASEDTKIEIDGWRDSSQKYVALDEGWNLVGGSVYGKSYRASTLISNLRNSDIEVDTVAVWSYELGRFNYRKEEAEGETYGEDIKLVNNQGIFLKK